MKREEMLKQLESLKQFCEFYAEKFSEEETWRRDAQALNTAIGILGDEYLNDLAYIKDLVNFIFIFMGFIAMLMLIIVCRI